MDKTQRPLVDQKEVDYYFKKYSIENFRKWEPEVQAKIVEFYKEYEAVCIPLKRRFMARIRRRMEQNKRAKS